MMIFPAQAPPRILVVDDNRSIHRDFDLVLRDTGRDPVLEAEEERLYGQATAKAAAKPQYIIDHALSGLEAVEKVQIAAAAKQPYQLAFVDIRMPGIDGVEAIERMWRVDPEIQMVICTAYSDYAWGDLARRLGPTDKLLVLKKPFDSIEVTQLASTLTEKWFLARRAALKLEEMELLVARRTQKLLDLQKESPVPASLSQTKNDNTAELPLILLVADDPGVTTEITGALENRCRISAASTEDEAFQRACEGIPDAVVIAMPAASESGLGLCRRLKRQALTGDLPVILATRSQSDGLRVPALEAGADELIVGPHFAGSLRDTLERLLSGGAEAGELLPRPAGTATQPPELPANQADARFLQRTVETIERHLSDYEFAVDELAQKAGLSRRQLFRKLRAVAGCTPNHLIRTLRLNRAAHLLKHSQMNVTEVTYAVGFSDLKHFREMFREHFGVLPGEYASQPPPPRLPC